MSTCLKRASTVVQSTCCNISVLGVRHPHAPFQHTLSLVPLPNSTAAKPSTSRSIAHPLRWQHEGSSVAGMVGAEPTT